MLPVVANDPDLAALNHPNIAHVDGLEESSGVQALIMELVAGETLKARIAKGALPTASRAIWRVRSRAS